MGIGASALSGSGYSANFYELRARARNGDKAAAEECVALTQKKLEKIDNKAEKLLLSWSQLPTSEQKKEWRKVMWDGRGEEKNLMAMKELLEPGFSDRYEKKYPLRDASLDRGEGFVRGLMLSDANNSDDEIFYKAPDFYRKMEMLPAWDPAQKRWAFPRYWDKPATDTADSVKS